MQQKLTETLARELGAQPAEPTRALAKRIASGAWNGAPGRGAGEPGIGNLLADIAARDGAAGTPAGARTSPQP